MSAHLLAALLVLVAVSGTFIHVLHARQRKRLYLASRPGSMAHYMSLLSHPHLTSPIGKDGVNGTLGPLDDDKAMENKLAGVQFMLNERSGTIVPVGSAGELWVARHRQRESWRSSGEHDVRYELEDPRRALLSPGAQVGGS